MKHLKNPVFIATALLALGWAGCDMMPPQPAPARPATPAAAPGASARTATTPAGNGDYLSQLAVKSEGPDGKNATAVESAIAWSDKYSKVSEDLVKTQQEKHDLEDKNQKLVAQLTKLQNDQDASQKELAEANQLLLEMRQDLDKWKASVIGFRDEMRSANKAQLEATRKVIILLGGEIPPSAAATTQPAAASSPVPPTGPAAAKARKGDSVEAGE
jgi:hypothetical protein